MKLTQKQLKQIINEEIENVMEASVAKEKEARILKAAEEMSENPILDKIFLQLSKDPAVKKIVAKTKAQKNEEVLGMTGDSGAPLTATAFAFGGYPSAVAFLGSSAGKLLLAKTATVMGTSLATLGTAAVGFLAPVAIAFLLDAAMNKATSGDAPLKQQNF